MHLFFRKYSQIENFPKIIFKNFSFSNSAYWLIFNGMVHRVRKDVQFLIYFFGTFLKILSRIFLKHSINKQDHTISKLWQCPFMVAFFASYFDNKFYNNQIHILLNWLLLIGISNSMLNPIVYGGTNKEFKSFMSNICTQAQSYKKQQSLIVIF